MFGVHVSAADLFLWIALSLLIGLFVGADDFSTKVLATIVGGIILALAFWLYASLRSPRWRMPNEFKIVGTGRSFDEATRSPVASFGLGQTEIFMNVQVRERTKFSHIVCALTAPDSRWKGPGTDAQHMNVNLTHMRLEQYGKEILGTFELLDPIRGKFTFDKEHDVPAENSLFVRLNIDAKRECTVKIEFEGITSAGIQNWVRRIVVFEHS